MSFWVSDIGEVTGKAEDAFAKSFTHIPDGTMALAKINAFSNKENNGYKYLEIDWELTAGDFKGFHVFHKIKVFEEDPKKRHRALNMLKLIYNMFQIKPKSSAPPSDQDLMEFVDKHAGLKIQETPPNEKTGKVYNWVSEVHPAANFKCETGVSTEVVHDKKAPESAFNRYEASKESQELDDDIPF